MNRLVWLLRLVLTLRESSNTSRRNPSSPQVAQSSHPVVQGAQPSQYVQSSQPPQQIAQQFGHQRFRPRGKQFKKKSGSSSSGSGSSSSGVTKVEYCSQCGGRHLTTQCGRGGSSIGRSAFPVQQQRLGEPQFRPFQQPGPSRFGQFSHPQFS
ncbi:hypothetical protein F511_23523 [Dorcoceras hygrometricum]|uniref:Uncharacterized protein n=1 Tax=Dorcoceras hygrometricum TaxID=472368 RepID=A0A2Z7D209_9LAMI|nr:hypothetical protein F511_23523 [Dorcoceras hygrometricum]